MGVVTNWYIDQPKNTHTTFDSITKDFLTFFQLPFFLYVGNDILTNFCQTTTTHISDHIHEWHRRHDLYKADINDQFIMEWFLKSLFPSIAKDVAMNILRNEEESIQKEQQYDHIAPKDTFYNPVWGICVIPFMLKMELTHGYV